MAEYTELIKALRHCYEDDDACATCQRWLAHDEWGIKCKGRLISDAAAAIEALQKRIVSALTALHLANEKMGYYGIQPYTEADGEDMISDWVKTLVHEELKQQLPKRGEWKTDPHGIRWCSLCDSYYQDVGYGFNYCPNCGAKMEVQE